jgi:hypothetical protein
MPRAREDGSEPQPRAHRPHDARDDVRDDERDVCAESPYASQKTNPTRYALRKASETSREGSALEDPPDLHCRAGAMPAPAPVFPD